MNTYRIQIGNENPAPANTDIVAVDARIKASTPMAALLYLVAVLKNWNGKPPVDDPRILKLEVITQTFPIVGGPA